MSERENARVKARESACACVRECEEHESARERGGENGTGKNAVVK